MTAAVLLALLGAAAISGADAQARIVLNRSIAGVRLDDSLARVHRVLGKPRRVRKVDNEITGGQDRIDVYRRLSVTTIGKRVFAVTTTRRSQRARGRIRVGIRVRALKTRLRQQGREPDCARYGKGPYICRVGPAPEKDPAGQPVTEFLIRPGRVRQVTVGRIVD